MSNFIQFLHGDNKLQLAVEDTPGYQKWFSGEYTNGVLCWVSSLRGMKGKRDLALITSVVLSDTYYPTFIPANSKPYVEIPNQDLGLENVFIK